MAVEIMKPGSFMASIDLKDAYYMYTVAIFHAHQKYLEFIFNGTLYQYTCMANGLSRAPRVFTKLLKPVFAMLHNLGYLSLGYMILTYKVTHHLSVLRMSKSQLRHLRK